jgi:hypothetical protein
MTDYRTVPVGLLNSAAGLLHNGGFFALADALNGIIDASPAPAGDLVERVARIIDPEAFDHPTVHPQHLTARRTKALDKARAVIAAMQPGWRDKPRCQSCGGEIQGWMCQGCGLTFRENEAGHLVAEPLPAPGVGG